MTHYYEHQYNPFWCACAYALGTVDIIHYTPVIRKLGMGYTSEANLVWYNTSDAMCT